MDNIDGIWVEKTDETYKNREFNYIVDGCLLPRIHIKCSNGDGFYKSNLYRIVHICGDSIDNNLAPEMLKVLEDKLNSMFHDGIIYEWSYKFWKDKMLGYVKRVGNIYEKDLNGIELDASEIAFIYRLIRFDITLIARKMELRADNYMSFGNSPDPRMDEIVFRRDHKKDFDKLPYEYQVIFLKMYDFPEIKVTDPNLIIDSGKIEYSSDDLLKDTKFVRKFLSTHKHSLILPYTKTNINNNKKLVMEHFQNLVSDSYDNLLMYLSARLKDDVDVVRLAIKINGNNIKDASDRLKNDKDTVMLALLNDCDIKEENFPLSMIDKYPDIKNVVDIIEIINIYSKIEDMNVKRILSNNIIHLIKHSPPEIRSSYKIMKKAFMINSMALNFASPKVQGKLKK